jgi:toxin ParE1/3/4
VAHYTISDLAARHLAEVWDYIKEQSDSEEIADRFADGLFATFDTLAHFPDMGGPRPYLPRPLLAFPHASYMIFYLKVGEDIEIAHILHGGRDFFSYFAEP